MEENKLTFSVLLQKSWNLLTKGLNTLLGIQLINFGIVFLSTFIFIFVLIIIIFVIALFLGIGIKDLPEEILAGGSILLFFTLGLVILIFIVCIWILMIYTQIATVLAIIDVENNKKRTIKEYFKNANYFFWRVFGLFLLNFFIVGVGFLFLIIPGFILGIFLIFTPYILISENIKIIDSIKKSFKMVANNFWKILGYYLLISIMTGALISISGFVPFAGMFVSLFISIFMSICLFYLYQSCKKVEIIKKTE